MPSIKPFIKNDYVKSTGKANIKIMVCHHGQTRFIKTEWNIEPKYMKGNGRIDDSYPNAVKLNMALNDLQNEYYAVIDNIGLAIRDMDINTLVSRLRNKDIAYSFIKFAKQRIEELKEQGRYGYAESFEAMITHLERFSPSLSFKAITPKFLEDFETYLKTQGCKTNTRRIYLVNLRAIFNVAMERELINLPSPFKKFRVKHQKSVKRALQINDIRKLIRDDLPPAQQRSADIFVLIMYLNGINLKDLCFLTKDSFVRGRIQFNRAKTDVPFSIKVFPEAEKLLQKYAGEKYLLRFMDEDDSYIHYKSFLRLTNDRLVQAFGGKISTYTARHSVASIMADLEIPIETISMALGHTLPGSTMTGIYISYNMMKVDEAMEKTIRYIHSQEKDVSVVRIAQ